MITVRHLRRCRRGNCGFTLLEIIVVAVIIILVMAMVVPRIGIVPQRVLINSACGQLRQVFQQAARRARASGTTVRLIVEPEERRFRIEADSATDFVATATAVAAGAAELGPSTAGSDAAAAIVAFPAGVTWQALDGYAAAAEPVIYTFYPNGEAGGPVLVLRIGKTQSQHLYVDRLTGQVHLQAVQP